MTPHPRHFGRRLLIAVAALVAPLAMSVDVMADSYWFETYERVVDMVDAGQMSEAAPILAALIQAHPIPTTGARVPGDRFIDYLPYYQRARIQLSAGNTQAASHSLDICEAFGAIQQNRRTYKALLALRKQIAAQEASKMAGLPAKGGLGQPGR